jgi:GT2 family glycosyltransferase
VDQIPGAFLFFRSDAFEAGTWLNEAYFLWMEDVHFCRRIQKAGLRVAVVTDASVTHLGGSSFKQRKDAWNRRVFSESFLTYLVLNSCGVARGVTMVIMAWDAASRVLVLSLRARVGRAGSRAAAHAAAHAEAVVLKLVLARFIRRRR